MSSGWKWFGLCRRLRPQHILPVLLLALWPCSTNAQLLMPSQSDIEKCETKKNPDEAIAACTRLTYEGTLAPLNLAIAYANRGSHWYDKGDYALAIADYDEALHLNPQFLNAYYNRALARAHILNHDGAITDFNEVIRLDPRHANAHNNTAWMLATTPVTAVRNGTRALELARKAAELTNWKEALILQTLAAAYAETGNFSEAVRWQTKALEFPDFATNSGPEALRQIEFYRQGQPYRATLAP